MEYECKCVTGGDPDEIRPWEVVLDVVEVTGIGRVAKVAHRDCGICEGTGIPKQLTAEEQRASDYAASHGLCRDAVAPSAGDL